MCVTMTTFLTVRYRWDDDCLKLLCWLGVELCDGEAPSNNTMCDEDFLLR